MAVVKEFGPEGFKVKERVAKTPSLGRHREGAAWEKDIFCLRIDADEYTKESFNAYYPVFEKYKEAVSIFFNVHSFRDAGDAVAKCRDMGLDAGSHAYYHHTYNDYASNRYNIQKAKEFLLKLGLGPKGYVSPYGKWGWPLQKALEDEGYEYSSEFSYDYMAFPSYPVLGTRRSNVLQIPVFPVAPELFYLNGRIDLPLAKRYFIGAIDEMTLCGLPVIIYAHTNPAMPEIPKLLECVIEYAVSTKGLKPISMSKISDKCRGTARMGSVGAGLPRPYSHINPDVSGTPVRRNIFEEMKIFLKNVLDYEKVTPPEELKCMPLKKMLKLSFRKLL